jgi:hypothetical protein
MVKSYIEGIRGMKRVLNIFLYSVSFIIVVAIASVVVLNKPLPYGEEGAKAEMLADSLMAAVNIPAWESLRYVRFSFRGEHHYVWDRWYNLAEIRFDDTRVLLNLNTLEGKAWRYEDSLEGSEKRDVLQRAWEFWCNDSFWLNPIAKLRDDGTVRKYVRMDDDRDGLLVTYTAGGVTPGDSYLWMLGEGGLPYECRMWVSALPIKGLSFTWEDWVNLEGAMVATQHKLGPVNVIIDEALSGDHHSDIGLEYDPFTDF